MPNSETRCLGITPLSANLESSAHKISVNTSSKTDSKTMAFIDSEKAHREHGARHEDEIATNRARNVEENLSVKRCISLYRPAVWMSFIMSLSLIMEGFDLVLITGFFNFPNFRLDFACPESSLADVCEIPAWWQTALVVAPQIGQIGGSIVNGWATERYGYKMTFQASLISLTLFIFVVFFSTSLPVFVLGLFLCGIPWGVFQTLTTMYASDICPTPIRGYLTSWTNACWLIGQLLGAVIQRSLVENRTSLAYKLPLGLQWLLPPVLFVASFWIVESPWWLLRHDRIVEAGLAVSKLVNMKQAPDGFSSEDVLSMMKMTNEKELEDAVSGSGMGWSDCFRGVNWKRTQACCGVFAFQNGCGSSLMQWSPYFLVSAGLDASASFTLVIVQYVMGLCGTVIAWYLLPVAGRRIIYLVGLLSCAVLLSGVGTIASVPTISRSSSGWSQGVLLLIFTITYGSTVGPVTYSITSEVPSTRLKSKTMNIARIVYNLVGIFNSFIVPQLINPDAWNVGGRAAWLYVGLGVAGAVFTFFLVPETKGRSFDELDRLYTMGISPMQFHKYQISPFAAVEDSNLGDTPQQEINRSIEMRQS